MKLEAPYPGIQVSTTLPNPTFNDSRTLEVAVSKRTAVDGTRRTYVKRKGRIKLQFTLFLTQEKTFELQNFIDQFAESLILLTDHLGQAWVVQWTGPTELTIIWKTRDQRSEVPLEFQGTRL